MTIEKSTLLPCGQAEAFALFTDTIGEWWPPERRHLPDPSSTVVLDPRRFVERDAGGTEIELGRVLEWVAPERLVLDWYPGTGPDHPTRVTVRFVPEDEGTRVLVEHGPTPASQDLFESRADRYRVSWDLVLRSLRAALDRG
jgi:uncharacterized protein YndB with AHSA1/START domain